MTDEYRRTEQELSDAVGFGAKGAWTVKHAAGAAGKAATGNIAGAAADILKDDGLRSLAAILLGTCFFIVFCAVFAFPMSVYEGLQAYVDGLAEQWRTDYYSGDTGRFRSFLKAGAGLAVHIAEDLWHVISLSGTGEEDTDLAEEADLSVLSGMEDLLTVYNRKIQAGRDKISARQKSVIREMERDAANGQISSVMYGRYLREYREKDGGEIQYNADGTVHSKKIYVYDGCEVLTLCRGISDAESLKLLCLYTAQKGGSVGNIQLSGFMKWLGYSGTGSRSVEYALGENRDIRYTMKSWTGGFMPQYLEDEAAKAGKTYEEYGAPLTDLLIQVDCPNLYSIRASETEEIRTDGGTGYRWVTDYSSPVYADGMHPESGSETALEAGNAPYGTAEDHNGTTGHGEGERIITGYGKKQVPYTYDITCIHVKYVIPVTVSCRDIDCIAELAGLWSGFLPEESAVLAGSSLSRGSGQASEGER